MVAVAPFEDDGFGILWMSTTIIVKRTLNPDVIEQVGVNRIAYKIKTARCHIDTILQIWLAEEREREKKKEKNKSPH